MKNCEICFKETNMLIRVDGLHYDNFILVCEECLNEKIEQINERLDELDKKTSTDLMCINPLD